MTKIREILKTIHIIKSTLDPVVRDLKNKVYRNCGIRVDIDDGNKLNEVVKILLDADIPVLHFKGNPALEVIDIDPDENFYSKHNRETHTISLSNQLFTPEFRKDHPYHRIENIPAVGELLVHEIGHAVNQMMRGRTNSSFDGQFGWAVGKDNSTREKLEDQNYMSALEAFLKVPPEKLTTIDDEEKERIAEKIREEGSYQKPDKQMRISWYGLTSPREDFAESYVNYVLNGRNFKKVEPERYRFMKQHVFGGKNYQYSGIRKSIQRILKHMDEDISTPLLPQSQLDEPYQPIPGTKEELDDKKKLARRMNNMRRKIKQKTVGDTK